MAGATLLIHFISDFLRDESLRCRVMEDENETYIDYGLSPSQRNVLHGVRDGSIDRVQLLAEINKEIGAIRFEAGAGEVLQYPAGDVQIRDAAVFSNGNQRIIRAVGIGFVADAKVTIDGTQIPRASIKRSCDVDVWQRLTITTELAPGVYKLRVEREAGKADERDIVCP
jgi:hypothetical protein